MIFHEFNAFLVKTINITNVVTLPKIFAIYIFMANFTVGIPVFCCSLSTCLILINTRVFGLAAALHQRRMCRQDDGGIQRCELFDAFVNCLQYRVFGVLGGFRFVQSR